MSSLKPRQILFISLTFLACAPRLVHAESEAAAQEEAAQEEAAPELPKYVPYDASPAKKKIWNFAIGPYLIIPFMTGSVTLRNQPVDVNVNTGDILKALNWGLFLYFEAAHPKFSIITDLLYVNLGRGAQLPVSNRPADLTIQQVAAEAVFLGRIVNWFELGFGGRVNFVQSGLTAPAGTVLPSINLDLRQTWFDPLMALRLSVPFKDRHWRLGVYFDFGGFGLGSTYAWKVQPYAGYRFDGIKGHRVFELALAFRAFGMKYETGSGANRYVYDLIMYGPVIGFLFHF
jgi:hypothetical protein